MNTTQSTPCGREPGFIPIFRPGTIYPKASIVIHNWRLYYALRETDSMPPRTDHWHQMKGRSGW
jgi:hypothetical protein